ncbi:MAG: hypothetical protein DRI48_07515 [Chloroflexi bacterium]|nr:MAG: hypothetical protein DRI48_07515 [Chloroflexota bacterium]
MREIRFDRAFSHRRDAENAELKPFFCFSLRPLRLCDKMWVITSTISAPGSRQEAPAKPVTLYLPFAHSWFIIPPMVVLTVLLGLLAGGLVNQLGSDLPARRSLTSPHCPYCGRNRPWWQWLAVLSYLIGRAHCPYCGAQISLRHPLTEIGLAVTYGYLWIVLGPSLKLLFYLLYSAIFALVLITDIERRLILNVVMYPAILLAFAASFFTPGLTWWSALTGGATGFVVFLVAAIVGNTLFGSGALGGGDVKLAAFVGLITGFPLIVEALVLTMLIGAGISLILLITRARGLRDYIPYGPFLIAGAAITLLWGYPIAERFLY